MALGDGSYLLKLTKLIKIFSSYIKKKTSTKLETITRTLYIYILCLKQQLRTHNVFVDFKSEKQIFTMLALISSLNFTDAFTHNQQFLYSRLQPMGMLFTHEGNDL